MIEQQIDIHRATFREVHRTPGHVTFGVWINGGKAGELVVRLEEEVAMLILLRRAFKETTL